MRRDLTGAALFAAVFVLYLATFSSSPTSDSYTWVLTIDQPDWDYMTLAAHPLPLWLVYVAKHALAALGAPVATLAIMKVLNAALAAAGAVLFYRTIRLLSGDALLAAAGGGLLAVSFGYWYFANGEIHHWGLVLIMAVFLRVLRRRARGGPGIAYGFAWSIGLLNALAIVLHQDAVLFGFAVVAMLVVGRPWRPGLTEAGVYAVAGSVGTAALTVWIGVFIRGVGSAREFFQWYFWPTWHMGVGIYDVGGVTGSVLRSLKAQLTAIAYGTQVALDVAREPALLREPLALGLLALTLAAGAAAGLLVWRLWRERRTLRGALLVPATGALVWLAVYKVFLNSWFQPASTEYHVVTVPPLLLLVLLGAIAAPRARGARAAVVTLLVGLVVANFWGAILPWHRYGAMKDALAARFAREFDAGDLFISSESGIDSIFLGRGQHVGVKDLFREKPRTQGFALLDARIRAQLDRRGRVFVYNLAPNPFTLRRINLEAAKRGDPAMAAGDFEDYLAGLRQRYALVPAATYWEETKTPLFLFGRRAETLWEVRPSGDPRPPA